MLVRGAKRDVSSKSHEDENANDLVRSGRLPPCATQRMLRNKYYGGVISPKNGALYCIPYNADRVLRISADGTDYCLLSSLRLTGKRKSIATAGKSCMTSGMENMEDAERADKQHMMTNSLHKWHGAVVDGHGDIVGIPSHAETVLYVRVNADGNDEVYELPIDVGDDRPSSPCKTAGSEPDRPNATPSRQQRTGGSSSERRNKRYQYGGGVLGTDGCVYCIPSDADRVLRVDPVKQEARLVGPVLFPHIKNKWQNGFLAASDGCIYCIPCDAPAVLRIGTATPTQRKSAKKNRNTCGHSVPPEDQSVTRRETVMHYGTTSDSQPRRPETDVSIEYLFWSSHCNTASEKDELKHVASNPSMSEDDTLVKEKWEGGALGLDGSMYCLPQQARHVLRIHPGTIDTGNNRDESESPCCKP
ncbi:unnamed protein product [Amoebophrya sp. A120]|nr:unnamed protein product [Amoebophrya sp. A120]|eukprot:GSA120T00002473001.1